jgi:hypothetical protein
MYSCLSMCRYFSGFFQWHPLLLDFDFYWRMEPDVHYYCNLDYDPFLFMQVHLCSCMRKTGHPCQHLIVYSTYSLTPPCAPWE